MSSENNNKSRKENSGFFFGIIKAEENLLRIFGIHVAVFFCILQKSCQYFYYIGYLVILSSREAIIRSFDHVGARNRIYITIPSQKKNPEQKILFYHGEI